MLCDKYLNAFTTLQKLNAQPIAVKESDNEPMTVEEQPVEARDGPVNAEIIVEWEELERVFALEQRELLIRQLGVIDLATHILISGPTQKSAKNENKSNKVSQTYL